MLTSRYPTRVFDLYNFQLLYGLKGACRSTGATLCVVSNILCLQIWLFTNIVVARYPTGLVLINEWIFESNVCSVQIGYGSLHTNLKVRSYNGRR